MTHPTITLELAVAEVNVVLGALGALPYRDVFALVESIRAQAGAQLAATDPPPAPDGVS